MPSVLVDRLLSLLQANIADITIIAMIVATRAILFNLKMVGVSLIQQFHVKFLPVFGSVTLVIPALLL